MTMRLTVDSSVFISALNPNDPFVEISQKFFSSIAKKGSKIIIPITIALEVDNILRKVGVRQKEVLKTFLEDKTIDIVYLDVEFLEKYWVHA
ncbi:MAG: hypothetical protein Q8O75_04160, partial [bacterium]|nr:hypothetical protein [bacterium]